MRAHINRPINFKWFLKDFLRIVFLGPNTGILINKFPLQLWLQLFEDYTMTNIQNFSRVKSLSLVPDD